MDSLVNRADQKKLQSGSCLFRRLFHRQNDKQEVKSDPDQNFGKSLRSFSDISLCRGESLEEMASTSVVYGEHHMDSEEYVRDNGSLLSLQPWIFKREKNWKLEEEDYDAPGRLIKSHDLSGYSWALYGSPNRIKPTNNRKSIRNRNAHRCTFRPVTYAENFFMPHFSDNVEVEEYTFSSLPSSPVKSFSFLTNRRTSKMRDDVVGKQPETRCIKEVVSSTSFQNVSRNQTSCPVIGESTTVIGVPQLPKTEKAKRKSREPRPGIDVSFSQKLCRTSNPHGSVEGIFLFLLGVAIGVISSMLTNRLEVEKLNKLLKNNEDLVKDLHEELEMKDSLTVKEIASGNYGNQAFRHCRPDISKHALQNHNSEWHAASWTTDNYDHECSTSIQNNPEALSEIEAELEAELERLEQNINASSGGQRKSNISELDQELVADVIVHGELREDLLDNDAREGETNINNGTCSTSNMQAYNPNYSVSPKELSLRLHRVIESRLEERIKELEIELEESQRKLNLVEAAESSFQQSFSGNGVGSSNLDNNPSPFQEKQSYPLCMNLAGDALNAYNEAYEEFIRLTETEEDEKMSSISAHDLPGVNQSTLSEKFIISKGEAWGEVYWTDDDEEDNLEDEGKDLIQKIIEKTRQGSPALLNAQRMFFLMDL